ncbi:hypothetical protein [Helicobacter didelphidarum]|nr:hypothetical protein [Helicobacter didelphidarum]
MRIIAKICQVYILVIVGCYFIACGYKTDPYWSPEDSKKQDLLFTQ